MKMKHKNICIILIIGIMSILMTGCQDKKNQQPDYKENQGEYIAFEAATEIVSGRDDIYAVLKVISSQYWQDIIKGMTDAANEKNCNL